LVFITAEEIKNRISEIEQEISELYDILKVTEPGEKNIGIIVSQRIRCGKSNCKCHTDKNAMHGPYYYQRIYNPDTRKTKTIYIRKEIAEEYIAQHKNYKQYAVAFKKVCKLTVQKARLLKKLQSL